MIKNKKIDVDNLTYKSAFFIALIVSCIIVFILSIYARVSIEDELYITKEQQTKIQRKFTESILSQEDILNKIYSEDYRFNVYMGDLHLSVNDYSEAEEYYHQAITLAPDATYNHYLKLLILYLRTGQPQKAEEIEKSVEDKNSQKLIKFKCKANLYLADYYYRVKEGLLANKKYRLANYYFDKMNTRKVKTREYIQNGLLASYVQIADDYTSKANYPEAYRNLKRAESVEPDNLAIKYKLALVLSYLDPMKAIDYYDFIKKHKPQMLSFQLYYEALMRAAEISKVREKNAEAKLYTYKATSVKNFYEKNIVNSEVIFLDFLHSKVQTLKKHDKFTIKFRLMNITTHNLDNVKMDVIFYREGKPIAKFNKTILDKEKFLRPDDISSIITVNYDAPEHYKKNVYENISYEIYLYSNEKYKTLMHSGNFAKSLVTEF